MTIVPDGVLFRSSKAHKQLRTEIIDKHKLIGVISMPSGIFSAPSKKGSASKGAGVKTSFIIFEKTNNGGTKDVWFYDMRNDGFTLDVKRTPIEGSNIPDIIARFNNLDAEYDRTRLDQSFMVSVDEIRANDYDLTFNKYKEINREMKIYRSSAEIIEDIKTSLHESEELMAQISEMIE